MVVKPAPLETFLSSVADRSENSGDPNTAHSPPAATSPGQTLILTILSQSDGPVPATDIVDHFASSELKSEACDEALRTLENNGLIQRENVGFALTANGREAAEKARARLLSPW